VVAVAEDFKIKSDAYASLFQFFGLLEKIKEHI
jgi:hypothetical protein